MCKDRTVVSDSYLLLRNTSSVTVTKATPSRPSLLPAGKMITTQLWVTRRRGGSREFRRAKILQNSGRRGAARVPAPGFPALLPLPKEPSLSAFYHLESAVRSPQSPPTPPPGAFEWGSNPEVKEWSQTSVNPDPERRGVGGKEKVTWSPSFLGVGALGPSIVRAAASRVQHLFCPPAPTRPSPSSKGSFPATSLPNLARRSHKPFGRSLGAWSPTAVAPLCCNCWSCLHLWACLHQPGSCFSGKHSWSPLAHLRDSRTDRPCNSRISSPWDTAGTAAETVSGFLSPGGCRRDLAWGPAPGSPSVRCFSGDSPLLRCRPRAVSQHYWSQVLPGQMSLGCSVGMLN